LLAPAAEERIGADDERAGLQLDQGGENAVDLALGARPQDMEVQALPLNFQTDSEVTILRGAFMDKKAKVVKILNNKVQVIIESLGYSLVAVIDKSNAALIGKE